MISVLTLGLKENSRVMLKMQKRKVAQNTLLFAAMVDRLSFLVWQNTQDAQRNINRPKSILEILEETKNDSPCVFDCPEDFETARQKIIKGAKNG